MTLRERRKNFMPLREKRSRDALIIFCTALAAYIFSIFFDPFEALLAFARAHEDLQLDELFWVLIVLCIGGLIYSIRRVRELSVAVKARRVAETEAQRLALHDPLTGLPNRRFFAKKLQEVLDHCTSDRRAAVLMLDLNYFKALNDAYGHVVGDKALIEFADRISTVAPAGAVIARVGGDEFAIVQPAIASLEEPTAFARRIVASMAARVMIEETSVALGVSVGIAIAPEDGTEPDHILRRADLALYRAKADGGSFIHFFEADMDKFVERHATLERELQAGIASGAVEVHYQPLINLESNAVIGFEALARWTSPTLGPIGPGEFIAIAEETGLINELGDNLLRIACRDAAQWPKDLTLSFNISPLQLRNASLGLRVLSIVAETGLSPHRLELEITESALVKDAGLAQGIIDELRAAGVRIALDDFGTGYATMSQLMALRFDKIKIDQSFISRLGKDPQSDVIVRATVGLARGLGLAATAEGIEENYQLETLRATGCAEGQGYLFGKAIPAGHIPALLAAVRRVAPQARAAKA